MSDIPDSATLGYLVKTAIRAADEDRPRNQQKAEGRLGPSDIGFCRAKALLTLLGTPTSDSSMYWAAVLGTTIGDTVEAALKRQYPHWLVGSIDKYRVGYTFPNGAHIEGQPDVLIPEWNVCLDIKTKDGLEAVRRNPWAQNYRYQTWIYTKGAAEAGILDPSKPLYVGLLYLDRSGAIEDAFIPPIEMLDASLEAEITAWIDDVISARLHDPGNLDALRDIPAPVCERICEMFTACRGNLPMEESVPILDRELEDAIAMYVEARELAKRADAMQAESRQILKGVNGSTPEWTVRWTEVPPSLVPGYERAPYNRLDIRRTRRRPG